MLQTLASNRISNKSQHLILVLQRKFATYNNSDFCLSSNMTGGWITSPLPIGNKLSNKSWKKLILTPEFAFNFKKFKQIDKDTASEASIRQFANELESSVRNEPTRFANFALLLPKNIHKNYIDAFLYGLAESDIKRVADDYKEKWQPCSTKLLELVILHYNNEVCEYALARLLENRATEWSEEITNLLIRLAKSSKNPTKNKLVVRDMKKGNDIDFSDAKSLYSTSINCVRGIAYRGISRIFWNNKDYALQNFDIVEQAIKDEHPAVNMSTISLLTPLLNYKNDYAHNKFIELCHKDLRMTCGQGAHHFFNQGFERIYQIQYVDLVLKMLESTFDDVRKEATRQVYARWFFNNLFETQVDLVLQGDYVLRSGCASVVRQFLNEDKYNDKINKIEHAYQRLINDSDEKILKKVGSTVGHDSYWSKYNSEKLFHLFVNSKAAIYCLYELFRLLEKSPNPISNLGTPLLQLVKNLSNNIDANQNSRREHIRETSLLNVLQRLYDEATEDEDKKAINICLDIWDRLLQSEMYSALSAINKLDKGLLS